jgi:hypothetical protein
MLLLVIACWQSGNRKRPLPCRLKSSWGWFLLSLIRNSQHAARRFTRQSDPYHSGRDQMRAHCSDADHAPLSRVSLERRNKRLVTFITCSCAKVKRESDVLAGNGKGRYGTYTWASPDHVRFLFSPRRFPITRALFDMYSCWLQHRTRSRRSRPNSSAEGV